MHIRLFVFINFPYSFFASELTCKHDDIGMHLSKTTLKGKFRLRKGKDTSFPCNLIDLELLLLYITHKNYGVIQLCTR